MARISTYANDATPTLLDKVIGTNVDDSNITMNYPISDILGLGVSSLNTLTGALEIVGGTGVTVTASGTTITLTASATAGVNSVTATAPVIATGTQDVVISLGGLSGLGSAYQNLQMNAAGTELEWVDVVNASSHSKVDVYFSEQVGVGTAVSFKGNQVSGYGRVVVADALISAQDMPVCGLAEAASSGNEQGRIVSQGPMTINTNDIVGPVSVGSIVYVAASPSTPYLNLTTTRPGEETNAVQNVGVITKTGAQGEIFVSAINRSNDVPNLAQGSIWVVAAGNARPSSLAIGANQTVLTSDGTTASWQPASGGGGNFEWILASGANGADRFNSIQNVSANVISGLQLVPSPNTYTHCTVNTKDVEFTSAGYYFVEIFANFGCESATGTIVHTQVKLDGTVFRAGQATQIPLDRNNPTRHYDAFPVNVTRPNTRMVYEIAARTAFSTRPIQSGIAGMVDAPAASIRITKAQN